MPWSWIPRSGSFGSGSLVNSLVRFRPRTSHSTRSCGGTHSKRKPRLIALEATGGLELPGLLTLASAGLAATVVNPRQARGLAKATGKLVIAEWQHRRRLIARDSLIFSFHLTTIPLQSCRPCEQLGGATQRRQARTRSHGLLGKPVAGGQPIYGGSGTGGHRGCVCPDSRGTRASAYGHLGRVYVC
jgi:transposase